MRGILILRESILIPSRNNMPLHTPETPKELPGWYSSIATYYEPETAHWSPFTNISLLFLLGIGK